MKIYCPQCEAENPEDAPLCGLCGHLLNATPTSDVVRVRHRRHFSRATWIWLSIGAAVLTFFIWGLARGGLLADVNWFLVIVYIAMVGGAVVFSIIPGLVASSRNHNNATAIWMISLLFGWTLLGWGIAMVWAVSNPPQVREANHRGQK